MRPKRVLCADCRGCLLVSRARRARALGLSRRHQVFHPAQQGNPKNLETIQHKWKIVKEMPEYVGIDPASQVNYGDWKRKGDAPSKTDQRDGANVQSLGTWYKDKDPTLSGFPGEKAGGLSVGDQPEPPSMSHAYIPPDLFDPNWRSASESEEYLQYGSNYIRE